MLSGTFKRIIIQKLRWLLKIKVPVKTLMRACSA